MDKLTCPDCRREVDVVLDFSSGDTICTECGLVLDSHYIDETSEWRTFSDDSGGKDPNRVGGPSNPLLTQGGLSTTIAKGKASQRNFASLSKVQNHGGNADRSLLVAFNSIETMADRLGLKSTIKYRADEIYKQVEGLTRGRSQDAIVAACLYLACREEGNPRTFNEMRSVANGTTKKEIGRASNMIVKRLGEQMGKSMAMGTIHAGDFIKRFCSPLAMSSQAMRAASEAVKRSEELDIRNSPISISAAAIYMIALLSQDKKSMKQVSEVSGVAEATIKNAYNCLRPHAAKLVPDWYAKPEDLTRLLV